MIFLNTDQPITQEQAERIRLGWQKAYSAMYNVEMEWKPVLLLRAGLAPEPLIFGYPVQLLDFEAVDSTGFSVSLKNTGPASVYVRIGNNVLEVAGIDKEKINESPVSVSCIRLDGDYYEIIEPS